MDAKPDLTGDAIPLVSAVELRERWETAAGEMVRSMVLLSINVVRKQFATIASGMEVVNVQDVLREQVSELPYTQQVLPALDLRGFEMSEYDTIYMLDLQGARLDYMRLGTGGIAHCDLTDACLDGIWGESCSFSGEFRRASFVRAQLRKAHMAHLHLVSANFTEARMSEAALKESNLRCAILVDADLQKADLTYANVKETDFSGADLRGASLFRIEIDEDTRFHGALFDATTRISPELKPVLDAHGVVWM
jgi:uncharacterized protein YjbI with pentapeptide repeats